MPSTSTVTAPPLAPADIASIERLLTRAGWCADHAAPGPRMVDDLRFWQEAVLALSDVAIMCPADRWPEMREVLARRLDDANRGVWLACVSALVARDGTVAMEPLLVQIEQATDEARVAIAARLLGRVGRYASEDDRVAAVARLTAVIRAREMPSALGSLVRAVGSMGAPGAEVLLDFRAEPARRALMAGCLPDALAHTRDRRARQPLLALHEQAAGDPGRRVACNLALGALLRWTKDDSDLSQRCADVLRADFLGHGSPAVAAAAGLGLVRAGLHDATPSTVARLASLLDDPRGRNNALRTVRAAQWHEVTPLHSRIEGFATDPTVHPLTRKIALAILLEVSALPRDESPAPR